MTFSAPEITGTVQFDAPKTLIGTISPIDGTEPYEILEIGANAQTLFDALSNADQAINGTWPNEPTINGTWPNEPTINGTWPNEPTINGTWL